MKRTTLFIALASAFSLSAFAAGEEQHSGAQSGQGAQGSTRQSASQQQKQSPELVKQVQQKLSENGQDVGQPDGKMGPKTQAALKEYQKEQGIEPTGQLDQKTLAALKIGQSGSSATGGSASPSKGGGASGSGAGSDDTGSKPPSGGAKQ